MSSSPWLTGFAPIHSPHITHLILGSFPSEASLSRQGYYGHPQNQFWRLMGAILGEPMATLDYQTRTEILLANRIGLWDVYSGCERIGSLDSAIRRGQLNPLHVLFEMAPALRHVGFNGKAAAKAGQAHIPSHIRAQTLPSSSPAYTLAFDAKLQQWRQFFSHDQA
ncbi:DNA-deoxyinosine glycosylase [Advenella sp. S44]|uniref:DNA-deoxyinosine glycosylase n=1 Tax=Advenella sp. S44 TaxID=1982755 RepID=UPI000C29714C|nr:DNA-deoxyinosine glycosylase [Advenella sp. S44]PJX25463.1 DNA-deoxyinosine glycosylase [Advenella sp. S44]